MPVLTIYNHGSGGSRLKPAEKGEMVNIFGHRASGEENVDFMITEGVGGKGDPHHRRVDVDGSLAAGLSRQHDGIRSKARQLLGEDPINERVTAKPLLAPKGVRRKYQNATGTRG